MFILNILKINWKQWRFLPKDFPPWQTVYGYFRKWHNSSVWFQMHERLRHKLRGKIGKDPHASVGIIDSQSVKTVLKGGTKAMTKPAAQAPKFIYGV
jgi:transposase